MSRDDTTHEAPTRRSYVKCIAALGSAAGLAGCTGSSSEADSTETESENESTETEESTSTTDTAEKESYTVNIEPAGKIEFQSPPSRWLSLKKDAADMCFALGQADGLVAFEEPSKLAGFKRWWAQIPDVSFSTDNIVKLKTNDRVAMEPFFEANPDVNLVDPNSLLFSENQWSEEELQRVSDSTGPSVGHFNDEPRPDSFPDYPVYTLYEEFEKYAEIFREEERYNQVKSLHDGFISRLRSNLPPEEERPTVGMFTGGFKPTKNQFDVRDFSRGGTEGKQYRDLEAINAFEQVFNNNPYQIRVDYELLLEVDPEVILIQWGAEHAQAEYEEKFFEPLRNDERGQRLSAVQNDRLYMGADPQQGPVANLFNTEMLAKQLYPEQFGEWNGIGERTEEERLFSRSQLGNILSS